MSSRVGSEDGYRTKSLPSSRIEKPGIHRALRSLSEVGNESSMIRYCSYAEKTADLESAYLVFVRSESRVRNRRFPSRNS